MYFFIERDDKKIASIELPDEDEDFWGSIEEHWPQSYDHIDEHMVIPGYIAVDTWDDRFFIGEDAELREWLSEVCARVVQVLDPIRGNERTLHEVEGPRDIAIDQATEWAQLYIHTDAGDQLEMDVRIRVGDEEVWSWLESLDEWYADREFDVDDPDGRHAIVKTFSLLDRIIRVRWSDGAFIDIAANLGDYSRVGCGESPIGWEDGAGHVVCHDVALELVTIPRKDWAKVFSEGKFDAWGEGYDDDHPLQPGTLNGRRFEVEYEFEPNEDVPHDADDEFWLSHVASIRWVME